MKRVRRPSLPLAVFALAAIAFATGAAESSRGLSRITGGDSAQEYWDIIARFDSSYSLFTRFLITNEGPGDRTAVATWYLVAPDGTTVPFRNGRRESRWSLSPDGARIEIGSSVFDQRGDVHALEYDSNKRGIKVYLRFTPRGPLDRTETGAQREYAMDLLDVGTPVVGTIWLEGMPEPMEVAGTISVTHTWMDRSEADLALRRIEFSSEDQGGAAVYLSEILEPSGTRHRWLVVERDGEAVYRTESFRVEADPPESLVGDEYPVPGLLRIVGDGVDGKIDPERVLVQVNPLDDIPQPFRFLLSFKTRPRRVWTQASFEVTYRPAPGLPATSLQGTGITTVTYLNPLPKTISKTDPKTVAKTIPIPESRHPGV